MLKDLEKINEGMQFSSRNSFKNKITSEESIEVPRKVEEIKINSFLRYKSNFKARKIKDNVLILLREKMWTCTFLNLSSLMILSWKLLRESKIGTNFCYNKILES